MRVIGRDEVRRLLDEQGAQLIDVLPARQYHGSHLPGARSLPLEELSEDRVEELDPDAPVIVYCNDFL